MTKKNAQSTESLDSNKSATKSEEKTSKNEIVYVQKSNYLVNIVIFCVAISIGIFLQYNHNILSQPEKEQEKHSHLHEFNSEQKPLRTKDAPAPFDMEAVYKEMSERLKQEIMDSLKTTQPTPPKEDKIINDNKPKTSIDSTPVKEEHSEIKLTPTNERIVLKSEEVNNKNKKEEEDRLREEKLRKAKLKKEKEEKRNSNNKKEKEIYKEAQEFKPKKINKMTPKKMWIPIPNSNGGHRRVPAVEIKPGKEHASSVKVWLYEEFLSKEECENLIKVHDSHLVELLKQKPIICFNSINTLRKNLIDLNKTQIAEVVTPLDFTEGTLCLNQTFSRQLEKWGLKWSFSTAFYPGESKFATVFGKRIEEATQLNETHGGKFQITSYPYEVDYKEHTDCILDSNEERDRYATFLVYLNDMGADGGGKTLFPELGIDVKPREGRALTWNNMNYETGKCEPKSVHSATKVEHVTKKKYIIQRWYYLKNFYSLGKRTPEANLPPRPPNTPKVSCDEYDNGSCRLYDEWNPDHMLEYRNKQKQF